jgi:anti-sigma factor RsiW
MMAASKIMLDQEPSEIELLLPWHAAGTLDPRDARRVEEALARDPDLAKQYAVIREEYAGTIGLNESLGAPSARAMTKLFAAIDADPTRHPPRSLGFSTRVSQFFASLSPRTLAWSAALGAVALLLQAGVIGAVLVKSQSASFQTASLSMNQPITRDLSGAATAPPRALVRFAPDARVADITALLDSYQASIVDGAKGGMFRLQFGSRPMSKDEITGLMNRLQSEKIVSLAVPTP